MTVVPPSDGKLRRPNLIDIQVGSRVRLRRRMLGMTQAKLGDLIGLSFQQVQKYEGGTNRIGASQLHELSRVLDVPVSFFFDDTDPVRAAAIPGGFSEPPAEAFEADTLRRPETLELVNAYYAIDDATVRQHLRRLAITLIDKPSLAGELARRRRGRSAPSATGGGPIAARDTFEDTRSISPALRENSA